MFKVTLNYEIMLLSSQMKKKDKARCSPYVLDLRKKKEGERKKIFFGKQNGIKKFLDLIANKVKYFRKRILKNFKNTINQIKATKLNFLKSKSKFSQITVEREFNPTITPFYVFRFKNRLANLFLFLCFVSILILPMKGLIYAQNLLDAKTKIIDHAAEAAQYLQKVKNSAAEEDIESIKNQLSKAKLEFILARKEADEINLFTKTLIKIIPRIGDSFRSGENILIMGECLAKAGQYFAEIADILQKNIAVAQSPLDKLELIKNNLALSLAQLQKSVRAEEKIKLENIPPEFQEDISAIKKYLPKITGKTEKLIHYLEVFQKILGRNELKRYLFIFQNNNEARATGGFAGSYALIDLQNGKIKNLEIPTGGSYDLEGGEKKNIIAPEPLRLINAHWHFWDANWFFDFPTSAEKLIEFYNNSGGPTVDGVVAINAELMQEIIGIIGPIDVPGFEISLTGENFIELLQEEGYQNKFKKEPKKLLSMAGPEIIKRIINQPDKNILSIINNGLMQKELQFYFSSYDLQREIMDLGWDGRILNTDKDYLAVVHTNLGGGKTDKVIKNEIWHNAEIAENGEVIDTLIITRFHQGQKGDLLTGIANNDYLRVYVPFGSKLITAYGFSEMPSEAFKTPLERYEKDELITEIEKQTEIDQLSGTKIFTESGKTVFGNWIHLEPGESKSVYLKYSLPFVIYQNKPNKREQTILDQVNFAMNPKTQPQLVEFGDYLNYYSLLIQKQSGIHNTNFTSRVKSLFENKALWNYPDDWKGDNNAYERDFVLNRDVAEMIVFEN